MSKILFGFSALALLIVFSSCETAVSGDTLGLVTKQDSLSYAHGVNYQLGQNGLGAMGINLDADLYLKGFNAAKNSDASWTYDKAIGILSQFSQELQTRQGTPFTDADPMKTNIDSVSIALGAYDSFTYKGCGFEVNGEAVCAGLREAQNEKSRLADDLITRLNGTFNMELNAAMMKDRQAKGEENKIKGIQFLTLNKEKEGVQVTNTGLQYIVVRKGDGASPNATQTVKVHYEGKNVDGKVFDSSYGRGEPTEFPVNRVIPGWTEGLQLMKVGAKYQFFIPSELGYGEQGSGANIGANETLIFDVELLEIK